MHLPHDAESTLTCGLSALERAEECHLALTILWHPDWERIGEQFVAGAGLAEIALNRFAPLFSRPAQAQRALEQRCIARESLLLSCDRSGALVVRAPSSRMRVALDGQPVTAGLPVRTTRLADGVVLEMGGDVVLCVHLTHRLPRIEAKSELLGVSDSMRKVRELIGQVAPTELPVLLLGESGTGKELVARAIHAASVHARGPMVAVNMAALSDSLAAADLFGAGKGAYTGADRPRSGFFAEAAGGTLFLDEIGNAPGPVQPMLLRVLDGGGYRPLGAERDVQSRARLVAATDQQLDVGTFNQPLLRRLEGFVIRLPALRERREDIGLLIAHAAKAWSETNGIPPTLPTGLVAQMCRYDWPGNVRQLGNVVRRGLLATRAGDVPILATLVPDSAPARPGAEALPRPTLRRRASVRVDDDSVLAALDANRWHIRAAAEALGISRPYMYKLIEAHPTIRAAEAITLEELRAALDGHRGDVERCAVALRTPTEALRRHLRRHSLIP